MDLKFPKENIYHAHGLDQVSFQPENIEALLVKIEHLRKQYNPAGQSAIAHVEVMIYGMLERLLEDQDDF